MSEPVDYTEISNELFLLYVRANTLTRDINDLMDKLPQVEEKGDV